MTIIWGEIEFEGPYLATNWTPPYRAAVYAIMIKSDPTNKPRTYRIIYFGESGNLSDRGFWRSHHKNECFIEQAGSESNLYIGIHRMPSSTQEQRKQIEERLVEEYSPICNE